MRHVLHDRYYNIRKVREEEKYLVQTRLQSKASGITLPEGHGVGKCINWHVQLEKQIIKPMMVMPEIKTPA